MIGRQSLEGRIKRRDEGAFKELFDAYAKLLWAIAGGVLSAGVGSEQDVEECVSDVFIELWNHPERFDPAKGSLKSYLAAIARNNAIDRYRKRRRENVVLLEDYMAGEQAEDMPDAPDYSQLYDGLRGLPEPTREIMVRRYFHGEKPAEIAERLALPKKEVENRLYRGKKALAESLSDYREQVR